MYFIIILYNGVTRTRNGTGARAVLLYKNPGGLRVGTGLGANPLTRS